MSDETASTQARAQPCWQPLSAVDRRVVGVLAEKAKTTPDAYPMSLNAICMGCNQKSNRHPVMQLEPADVQESLDRLRDLGAVGIIEGYGRVAKYRHYLYEWLGVEKIELSVMTELLLRGDQTVGELRGRASRMDLIADLAALKTILDTLKSRGLVISLTPEGRGHVVSHALYKPRELEELKAKYAGGVPAVAYREEHADHLHVPPPIARATQPSIEPKIHTESSNQISTLLRDMENIRMEIAQLRTELETIAADQRRFAEELRNLKEALGG
ncbi:MAG TPA: DUF480 domain-containing protein [Thermoguttaceae bacterium]